MILGDYVSLIDLQPFFHPRKWKTIFSGNQLSNTLHVKKNNFEAKALKMNHYLYTYEMIDALNHIFKKDAKLP